MRKDPEALVVDESTTALSQAGRDIIYGIMNRMKEENKAVIFISHDLEEIMHVCDALTVLRDGKIIRTFEKAEFDEDAIKTSMIGREMEGDYYRGDKDGSCCGEIVETVRNVEIGDDEAAVIDFMENAPEKYQSWFDKFYEDMVEKFPSDAMEDEFSKFVHAGT